MEEGGITKVEVGNIVAERRKKGGSTSSLKPSSLANRRLLHPS